MENFVWADFISGDAMVLLMVIGFIGLLSAIYSLVIKFTQSDGSSAEHQKQSFSEAEVKGKNQEAVNKFTT